MPATFEDFGLKPEDIDAICEIVADAKGEEFGGFKKLNRADVRAIYESCF